MTDTEMLDAIERDKAWLTQAESMAGTKEEWRCYVWPQHYATPDIRERSERIGNGRTAREALRACYAQPEDRSR